MKVGRQGCTIDKISSTYLTEDPLDKRHDNLPSGGGLEVVEHEIQ